ncbi:hypothetical protein D3C76_407200 [compost metagenome]
MSTIILTAIICATPIPTGATVQDVEDANCQYATKAYTSSHNQCDIVRGAFMTSIGEVNFHGYFLCAWNREGVDPDRSLRTMPRMRFNSQKGF